MAKHEFGIIKDLKKGYEYCEYEPERYSCISVDDDLIEPLMKEFLIMKTYFHNTSKPKFGLNYIGITLIPQESLKQFREIIISTKYFNQSPELIDLANLISKAINENKYIIHYGL